MAILDLNNNKVIFSRLTATQDVENVELTVQEALEQGVITDKDIARVSPPFEIGEVLEFDTLYGSDYIKAGQKYIRVEGQHFYDTVDGYWIVDGRKLFEDEHAPEFLRPSRVMIYMIPAWALKKSTRQEAAR